MKLYRRSVLQTRTNQKTSSSNSFLRRKNNHNAFTNFLTNKKRQKIRHIMTNIQLQMKCRAILTYSYLVGIFWTYLNLRMNERAWPPRNINTLRIFWKILLTTMIVTMHHCPMRSFDKQSVKSWQKRKRNNATPITWLWKNVTPIMWLWILSDSPPSRPIHKERM